MKWWNDEWWNWLNLDIECMLGFFVHVNARCMLWISMVWSSENFTEKCLDMAKKVWILDNVMVFLALIEYCTVIIFDHLMLFQLFHRVDSLLWHFWRTEYHCFIVIWFRPHGEDDNGPVTSSTIYMPVVVITIIMVIGGCIMCRTASRPVQVILAVTA